MKKCNTPEEILSEIESKTSWVLSSDLIVEVFFPAMLEYGRQQYELGNEHGRTYYSRKAQSANKLNFDVVEKVVCDYFEIKPVDIQIKTRKRKIIIPRQLCHHISFENSLGSLAEIGYRFGKKDHATVLHSTRTIKNLRETNRDFRKQYDELISKF